MTEAVRGHLVVTVHESSGRNKDDTDVWDPTFTEGFVKVEIRGGPHNVKVISSTKRVLQNTISWNEELTLNVLEGATELRLMLCREKRTANRVGTSVVAACGIFVADILEAVPIDKYFELFKPGAGGDGGFIRIGMNYEDAASRPMEVITANGHDEHAAALHEFKPMLSFKNEMPDQLSALVGTEVTGPDTPQTGDKKLPVTLSNGEAESVAKPQGKKPKRLLRLVAAAAAVAVVAVGVKASRKG